MNFSYFEIIMLICFGFSWPFALMKTLRTKRVEGKSFLFMYLVAIGYVAGISHKFSNDKDFVIFLYMINLILVCSDIIASHYYSSKNKKRQLEVNVQINEQ
ncbi:hypothetical protein AAEX28_02555 [Lentisphaerota bacterium WC36G]|nr:hypothetical protein LJT99_05440 [Lentisphaerae bacterium WC36]